jgi:dTDP-4-dehydrorhamnose 3,5-epimerase
MNFEHLKISGAVVVEEPRHEDSRGWFQQWHQSSTLGNIAGFDFQVLQSNISCSRAGTIRGIHYSVAPVGQAKFVTVMSGQIEDVVVDIRVGSPTFGQSEKVILRADQSKSLLIGPGLGHAFQALEDNTVVSYLLSSEYNPEFEFGIDPFCPVLDIKWSTDFPHLLSEKDLLSPTLETQELSGHLPAWESL